MVLHTFSIFYLENYKNLVDQISSLDYPKSPKVICVASLQHDDLLSAYVAINVEKKSKFLFIKHGGGFGFGLLYTFDAADER